MTPPAGGSRVADPLHQQTTRRINKRLLRTATTFWIREQYITQRLSPFQTVDGRLAPPPKPSFGAFPSGVGYVWDRVCGYGWSTWGLGATSVQGGTSPAWPYPSPSMRSGPQVGLGRGKWRRRSDLSRMCVDTQTVDHPEPFGEFVLALQGQYLVQSPQER